MPSMKSARPCPVVGWIGGIVGVRSVEAEGAASLPAGGEILLPGPICLAHLERVPCRESLCSSPCIRNCSTCSSAENLGASPVKPVMFMTG